MTTTDPWQAQAAGSDERMAVRTPEHVQLNFLLAGAGNRFLALLTDFAIQWLLFLGIVLVLGGIQWVNKWSVGDVFGKKAEANVGLWIFAGFLLLFFGLQWGYFTFFETIWSGQTPGKRRQRIRVIRENGRPIGFAEAAIRNLLRSALDSQPFPLHAIGFLVGMLNDRFKRLGDFAAGTVVIVERRQSVPGTATSLRPSPQVVLPKMRLGLRQLSREEVAALQAYLRRRDELKDEVRSAMARKIALSLMQRLDITRPADMSNDAFLEWLDEEVRKSQSFWFL